MIEGGRIAGLEYGVESVARPGERESGDLYVVQETPGGVLLGVIDGLGHGADAVSASRLAGAAIRDHAGEPIAGIVEECDRTLRGTRGVVMTLVEVDFRDDSLSWFGVGNVEGMLVRTDPAVTPAYETLVMKPGVVGYRLPPLVARTTTIGIDDVLILSTDGIRGDYSVRMAANLRSVEGAPAVAVGESAVKRPAVRSLLANFCYASSPRDLAVYIGTNYVKGSDDALVLVAKYHGRGGS